MTHRKDIDTLGHRRLFGVVCGHENAAHPLATHLQRHRQYAAHATHFAAQRQFADHRVLLDLRHFGLTGGGDQPHRDRQIVDGALLLDVRWREVDRIAAGNRTETSVVDRRPDAILAFAHSGIRQPDDHELRLTADRIDLDLHGVGIDAIDRTRINP